MGEGDRGAGSLHFLRPGLGREVAATGGGGNREEEATGRRRPGGGESRAPSGEPESAPSFYPARRRDRQALLRDVAPAAHPTRSKKRRATPRMGCTPLLYRHIRPPPGSGPGAERDPRYCCGPKLRKAPKVPLRLATLKGTRRDRCGPERRGPESKAEPGRGPRP